MAELKDINQHWNSKGKNYLQSIDKKLGSIISITEIADDHNLWYKILVM